MEENIGSDQMETCLPSINRLLSGMLSSMKIPLHYNSLQISREPKRYSILRHYHFSIMQTMIW